RFHASFFAATRAPAAARAFCGSRRRPLFTRGTITVATFAAFAGLQRALVLRHWIVLEDLAFEDPNLHADLAVGRVGFGEAVIDVGAQRVQRHAAFAIPFHARDFRAAQTARHIDADALRAEAHGRLHRRLHRAAEPHAA